MIGLGVDIGGTGCKCVAFRCDGTQLATAYTEYPLPAGTSNLPPDVLTSSVFQVIARCVEQLPDKGGIAVITVSSFGESFTALDADGNALTDILMYYGNSDSGEFSELVSKIGEEKFMEITRLLPDTSYSLSGMIHAAAVVEKPVWKFLFVAGFICYQLCGRPCTDVSLACRSLLYDVKQRCWSQELTRACGLNPDMLPEVLPSGSIVGNLLPNIALQLGLPYSVKVVIGAHDQIVNALGAGVTDFGDAVDTSGTCECLTPLFADIPKNLTFLKNHFACVPYPGNRGYVTYAYNISAGSVIRWFRDALGSSLKKEAESRKISAYDLLNEICPKEPTNLMLLPFLQGMGGTPETDPLATGLIAGLTTKTRMPDIYRGILEGITYEMRYNQEKLNQDGVYWKRLYACGGGAKSTVWLQIKADILGCEIIPVLRDETGAMGSAILGIAAVTGENVIEMSRRFLQYGEVIHPNPEYQTVYSEKYQTYKALRALYTQHKKKSHT